MIDVTCAIIVNAEGLVLAARRGETMDLAGKWEFPGGKTEAGETEEQCLIREIKEELDLDISIIRQLPSCIHHYPAKSIRLMPFVCGYEGGSIQLKEHAETRWVRAVELLQLDWAEADIPVVKDYLNTLRVTLPRR